MPLYEYKCPKCGHTFEKIKRTEQRYMEPCLKCGTLCKNSVGKIAHFEFKGVLAG